MKYLLFLICLTLGTCQQALGLDFRIKGQWIMSFGYGENGKFQGTYRGQTPPGWGNQQDAFEPSQRLTLQLDAMASPDLSATITFESLQGYWGQASSGGALGGDEQVMQLNNAYLHWRMPSSEINVLMGLESIITPAAASGSSVLNDTLAGLVVNFPRGRTFQTTLFWGRPLNDNYPGYDANGMKNCQASFLDNVDAVGVLVTYKCAFFTLTPWFMYAGIGPNASRGQVPESGYPFGYIAQDGNSAGAYMSGMFPAGGARHENFSDANASARLTSYAQAWWGGLSGSSTIAEQLKIAFDFTYGASSWQDSRLNRAGWLGSLSIATHLAWTTVALYGWYGSGDDGNPANGSERLPSLDPSNSITYSFFAFDNAPYIERDGLIGDSLAGMWGVGLALEHLKSCEVLTHTLRVNYFGGTNSPKMAQKMSLAGLWANGLVLDDNYIGNGAKLGMPGLYMTTRDTALELSAMTKCKLDDNLILNLEGAYIALWLDQGVSAWGARHKEGRHIPAIKDAWNINASLVYQF